MNDRTLSVDEAFIRAIERPHANLMKLYFLQALCALFVFPIVIVPLYFRYHMLRNRFDVEGISARWGILGHGRSKRMTRGASRASWRSGGPRRAVGGGLGGAGGAAG